MFKKDLKIGFERTFMNNLLLTLLASVFVATTAFAGGPTDPQQPQAPHQPQEPNHPRPPRHPRPHPRPEPTPEQPSQPIYNDGQEIWGVWQTDVQQVYPHGTITLDLAFRNGSMDLRTNCYLRNGGVLSAIVQGVPVQYYGNSVRVLTPAYARVNAGPFFCEASIASQVFFFNRANRDNNIYRLDFTATGQVIHMFRR